ncbi:MAG TPA: NYN domain-containing protein, partial [Verrucomicrobiae bacterium]|nr:NYN domain-containing protein [Verrucomicrobiae bacterium]
GQVKLKGNLDIELVFRMLAGINSYDEAVIFGGDSDYLSVVAHLRNLGKMVSCVGRRASTSIELINECDRFMDLNDIRTWIERD